MIERTFMAADDNNDQARQDGPFKTAEAAEARARKLGWDWVVVYTHAVDAKGKIHQSSRRFYQPTKPALRNPAAEHTPEELEVIRRELNDETPDVMPLTEEEIQFFTEYEITTQPGLSQEADDVPPLTGEEISFFSEYERQAHGKA